MFADPLVRLRLSLLHALGLSACVVGCTERPLDPAGMETAASATTTAPAPAETTTAAPNPTTGHPTPATTTISTTTSDPVATTTTGDTTEAAGSTTTGTTGPLDPSTTTTGNTTLVPDLPCTTKSELGVELMSADVIVLPGCEDHEPPGCVDYIKVCAPLTDGLESCDQCAPDCLGELPDLCDELSFAGSACGPFPEGGECCHVLMFHFICGDGRPFLVEGTARTADPIASRAWARDHADHADLAGLPVAALDPDTRAELAALWTLDALAEHASIASFARFSLQLLALGAPPELVQAAGAAQNDEVAHARVAFALASRYRGAPVGPGPLALTGALAGGSDIIDIIVAVVREGCVGETIAAAELDMAARTCDDPLLADTLRRLAADEQRHAALAWQTLKWALGRGGPELRQAVHAALAVQIADPPPDRLADAVLRRHGRLPARERVALAAACMRSVVLPCAHALLADAEPSVTASPSPLLAV